MSTQLKQSDLKDLKVSLCEEQDYICPICNRKQELDSFVVDHQHTKKIKGSGLVRGAICRLCNVFLAKSENNCIRYKISLEELPNVLRNIADYLEKEHFDLIHPTEKQPEPKLKKSSFNKLMKVYQGKKELNYPKSGKMTKHLKELFTKHEITPEFY
jgi:hypothetical protein